MKTYLKWATLAMVLIAPAGVYAADSVGGPISNHQEAQQEPQRILDPVEFFDKTTGKVKVWYWRAESGYEFYDATVSTPARARLLPVSRLMSSSSGSSLRKTRSSATLSSEARVRRSYIEIMCLGWTQRPDASVGW